MVTDSPDNDSGETYTFQYSTENEDQPLLAIVESVAWVKGVDANELAPLHRAIDIDTLNELLGRSRTGGARTGDDPPEVTVKFRYEECIVTVTPDKIAVERD